MKLAPEGDWVIGQAFHSRAKHHEGIQALWETKWRFPVSSHECARENIG